jgi:acyl carrier protein
MTEKEIYLTLTDVFQDVFDNDTIVLSPELTPGEIPGWDSARYITLIVATEARFKVRFQPTDLEALKTVGDFVQRIQGKLDKTAAA